MVDGTMKPYEVSLWGDGKERPIDIIFVQALSEQEAKDSAIDMLRAKIGHVYIDKVTARTSNGATAKDAEEISRYAKRPPLVLPRVAEPAQLAGMVEEAIGQIGESAAASIEKQAADIVEAAEFIAKQLRLLAQNMREYAARHGEQTAAFCGRMTSTYDIARKMAQMLQDQEAPPAAERTATDQKFIDDLEERIRSAVPAFLKRHSATAEAPRREGSGVKGADS